MVAHPKTLYSVLLILCITVYSETSFSTGFTIELYDGKFYGPGNMGVQDIKGGSLENFVVNSPMTGLVPFFNNGAKLPNVDAESQHTGAVDGLLSDGTKINENVNAAFVLEVPEPETGENVKLFVGSISEEEVRPDKNDNLTFNLHAAFDTGFAQDALRLPVQFITGMVTVPISEKDRRGLPGGHNSAGPIPAGQSYVGRLGDFDQDSYMDGVFVLAGNTPFELIIAEGDPVLIVRPFRSNIPINAREASYYELNGISKNFRDLVISAFNADKGGRLVDLLQDVDGRVNTVIDNFKRARVKRDEGTTLTGWTVEMPQVLGQTSSEINEILDRADPIADLSVEKLNEIFDQIDDVFGKVRRLQKKHLKP